MRVMNTIRIYTVDVRNYYNRQNDKKCILKYKLHPLNSKFNSVCTMNLSLVILFLVSKLCVSQLQVSHECIGLYCHHYSV